MAANDRQIGGDHYQGKVQLWDFAEEHDFSPVQTLAFRYLCRYKKKDGLKDIEKLIHCAEKLKELWIEEYGDEN